MDEEDQLVAAGEMGDKIKAFIAGEIGQYLMSARDRDEQEAIGELLALDPFEYLTLAKLQNEIAKIQENVVLARKVHAYLGDAIIRGQQADELLMSKEES